MEAEARYCVHRVFSDVQTEDRSLPDEPAETFRLDQLGTAIREQFRFMVHTTQLTAQHLEGAMVFLQLTALRLDAYHQGGLLSCDVMPTIEAALGEMSLTLSRMYTSTVTPAEVEALCSAG